MRRLAVLLLSLALTAQAVGGDEPTPPAAPPPPSLGHRLLFYLPNRLCDGLDIVRFRLRAGPGLALHLRATRWGVFYAGGYRAVFAGLPGPRLKPRWPLPFGREEEKGLALLAVDATDTLPHEPIYADSEIAGGLHLAVVGAELGLDPVELADFLLGFFLIDIRRDDH